MGNKEWRKFEGERLSEHDGFERKSEKKKKNVERGNRRESSNWAIAHHRLLNMFFSILIIRHKMCITYAYTHIMYVLKIRIDTE